MSSAEKIASAIDRMRLGCVRLPTNDPRMGYADDQQRKMFRGELETRFTFGSIVDVTAIYEDFLSDTDKGVFLYEESLMRPPLMEATYCYYSVEGKFTAVIGASTYTRDDPLFEHFQWGDDRRTGADHPLDWDDVKWLTSTALYIFPDTAGEAMGPVASWRFAINEDGIPLDINWVGMSEEMVMRFENAVAVFAKAVTWLNCRNIDVVVPTRPRPEQRRLARYKTEVNEIHIRPVGKTYQDRPPGPGSAIGSVPLHTVRGHIAKYGIDGRKKLFGRISGTFWIPAHARGSADNGERDTTRIIDTPPTKEPTT